MKNIASAGFLVLCLFTAACTDGGSGEEITKDDARGMGKADWTFDYCEELGWYGDGVCDDFCPEPDPDCVEASRCGPFPGGTCASGKICDIRSCGLGSSGTCVDQPGACIEIYAPVCGCDGQTYGNDCERLAAGAMLDHEGACESAPGMCGGIAGLLCPSGQTCDIRMCGADMSGTCVVRPDACAEIYEPVCGCDGVTYGNDCHRVMAGAGLDHEGACESAPGMCGGIAGILCPEGKVCDLRICVPDASGSCVDRPQACAMVYEPVCGCDGHTYGNDCERLEAGAGYDHDGPCGASVACGPYPGGFCADGQVCDIHSCGLGASGTCTLDPDACIEVYEPVCGCNGVTYSNNCHRLMAGTALDHDGPCGG
jgi:hypothetical protein